MHFSYLDVNLHSRVQVQNSSVSSEGNPFRHDPNKQQQLIRKMLLQSTRPTSSSYPYTINGLFNGHLHNLVSVIEGVIFLLRCLTYF